MIGAVSPLPRFQPDAFGSALLAERSTELGLLRAAFERVHSGGGVIVLVEGEEGIGKTSIISAFLSEIEDEARVFFGSCDDMLAPRPLGPFRDMLRDVGVDIPSLSGPEGRDALIEAMLDLMESRLRPAVVVVDDAHWADDGTLDVIRYLGRRLVALPSLLLISYRSEGAGRNEHLERTLGSLASVDAVRIEVARLPDEAVERLVASAGVSAADVVPLVAGNPFYLSEVLAAPEAALPVSIRDAVTARLRALPPRTQETLEIVSVSPHGVNLELIESMVDGAAEHLEPAEAARIVILENSSIRFRHELARLSVAGSLGDARRIALHGKILEHLVEASADPATIVHHAAEAHAPEMIVRYGPVAANQAVFAEDHQGTVTLVAKTLSNEDELEPSTAARLNAHASYAYYALNRFHEASESARSAVQQWRQIESGEKQLANALLLASRMHTMTGQPEEAREAATEALEILEPYGPSRDLALACAMIGNLNAIEAEGEAALTWCDRAVRLARDVGADDVETHALIYRGVARIGLGDLGGFDDNAAAIDNARRLDHGDFLARAASNRAAALIWLGRHPEATAALDIAEEAARDHRLDYLLFHVSVQRSHVEIFEGRWDRAEGRLRQLVETEQDPAAVMIIPQALLGLILIRKGGHDGDELIERAWARAVDSRQAYRMAVAGGAMIEMAWLRDDVDTMRATAEVLLPLAERANLTFLRGEVLRYLQRIDDPAEDFEQCPAALAAGLRGEHLLAAEEWGRLGNPFEQALEQLESPDTITAFGGLRQLDDLGATATASKYRQVLRERGMASVPRGPQRSTREIAAPLTVRQLEVLTRVAAGRTSPEIAEELFVSRRTVDNHISAILTRLDVSSRADAVEVARERGWVST